MISTQQNEYLTFLSKYFSVKSEVILEKSLDCKIISIRDSEEDIVNKLKSVLGYQRRILEPLKIAFTKTTPFDTIGKLVSFRKFDKHYSLLVADSENIFQLLYFFKERRDLNLKLGSVIKIDSCYYKDGKLFTNQEPKNIWFYAFNQVFTIKEYFLDNLPECIYDEEYTKKTNLVTLIGYLLAYTTNDKKFYFIYSRELQIRIIPYKIEDITSDLSTKLVKISYCELEYGPDAFQLKMSEFSDLIILSKINYTINIEDFKKLIRFEYPTVRMSLSEITDKSVACTKVKVLTFIKSDSGWRFFGYDSSQAVCITVFDDEFASSLSSFISDEAYFLMNGIYKRGKKYYLRERLENIEIITLEEDDEFPIPISKPDQIDDEKLVILEITVIEIIDRSFLSKENKNEKYERIKAMANNLEINIHNYNKNFYRKFLIGQFYRIFFIKSKFYNGNIYFIMNNDSIYEKIS